MDKGRMVVNGAEPVPGVRNPIREHYVERFWAQSQSSIRRPFVPIVHQILDIYPCKKPEMGWWTSHEHDWYMPLFCPVPLSPEVLSSFWVLFAWDETEIFKFKQK